MNSKPKRVTPESLSDSALKYYNLKHARIMYAAGVAYQEEKARGLVEALEDATARLEFYLSLIPGIAGMTDEDYFKTLEGKISKDAMDHGRDALAHYKRSEAEGNRQGQEKNDGLS